MAGLQRLVASRKTGKEHFHINGQSLDFELLNFWQWSSSDLVNNALRGVIAEYIIAQALGVGSDGVREEWVAFDIETPSGIKIEVKSAAYVQSWHQNRLSSIIFSTPKKKAWDSNTNLISEESNRQANVYVFALLFHKDKMTIDPLNLDQWIFYVLPTSILNARKRSQHSITLNSLRKLCSKETTYSELPEAVERCAGKKLA